MALEAQQVADAYVAWMASGDEAFYGQVSDECHDNVSGGKGSGVWKMVGGWIDESFAEREVELNGCGTLDDGRIAIWVTMHGTHVGSAMPWLADRAPSGRRIAWKQLHVFRTDGERIVEHWAVRDDLRVIEAIDAAP